MRYLPHTERDIAEMLETIALPDLDSLFASIPDEIRLQRPLQLPPTLSESELLRELKQLAAANAGDDRFTRFLGGGAYDHFIPAVIDQLILRSEFYTAYTPYQPEISQGTLQAIFEYQSLICQLTGMEVANASMYDGASACAEGVLMAVRAAKKRRKVLLSAALHPEYRETVATYCRYLEIELVTLPYDASGGTDLAALEAALDEETAAVVVGYPNFFGVVEPLAQVAEQAHNAGARLVTAVAEPLALGLYKSPGELGADIVVGEGQSFGIPLSYGGPYLGFFAARKSDVRSMPGRLVGQTVDQAGERGFVLTLATREQHIRREKATSNICSNEGLCALMATIYLALLGKQGIREVAQQNFAKADYARKALAQLPGVTLPFAGACFNEFVIELPKPVEDVLTHLEEHAILGGIPLSASYSELDRHLLVCVTEQNSRAEIDALVAALGGGLR